MKREFFDDCIEAVISHHENTVVGNNQFPIYHIHMLDGNTISGNIVKVTPSLITISRGEDRMKQLRFLRRELVVSAELTYKTVVNL